MTEALTPEVVGVGSVAIALITAFTGIVYKLFRSHTSLTQNVMKEVIEVVKQNAVSNEKMADALRGVQSATNVNTQVTRETKDKFSEILVNIIQKR